MRRSLCRKNLANSKDYADVDKSESAGGSSTNI